jgi:hypothetical protein
MPAQKVTVSATFARPANTTAYTLGDVISSVVSGTVPAPMILGPLVRGLGSSGWIIAAKITTNNPNSVQVVTAHLYNAVPSIMPADNVPMYEKFVDDPLKIDTIAFAAMATPVDGSDSDLARSISDSLRIPFVCAGADNKLYVVLQDSTTAGDTPASGQTYTLTLTVEMDE